MAGRSVHFALTAEQEARLLAAVGDDDLVLELVGEIEEIWDRGHLMESDKAWEAIHRCFCNGKLLYEGGQYPLNHFICGGRQMLLDEDADMTVSYVGATAVVDVAAAAKAITKEEMQSRYKLIKQRGYGAKLGTEDFEYAWSNFLDLAKFYAGAATSRRAVIFSLDC